MLEKKGCIFNSNNSPRYLKRWQENYSMQECSDAYKDEWENNQEKCLNEYMKKLEESILEGKQT